MDLSIEPKAGARTGLQRSGNVTCFKLDSLGSVVVFTKTQSQFRWCERLTRLALGHFTVEVGDPCFSLKEAGGCTCN